MTTPINEWPFTEGYTIHELSHAGDLHRFAVIQGGKETGCLYPRDKADQNDIIDRLDGGYSIDGWEDGKGGTISAPAAGFIEEYSGISITYGVDPFGAGCYWAYEKGRQLFDGIDFLPDLRTRIDEYLEGLQGR